MALAPSPHVGWPLLGLCLLLTSAAWADAPAPQGAKPQKFWVYIGTYTGGPSKGIYRFEFDLATGQLTRRALAGEVANPSFLAIHPNQRFLYAVSEISNLGGKKTGGVSAFSVNPTTGDLTLLNQQSSEGAGPCHLVVDREGKYVLAANYSGGSACVLPIGSDGRVGKATSVVQHKGSSINPQRQEAPHAHSINLDLPNRFAVVADLGLDKVLVYRYDAAKGTLTPNDLAAAAVAPGAGPRHFAFHPDGKHAYVINELNSTVTAFDYDSDRGVLKPMQSVTTLPAGVKGNNYPAEVQVHPSGQFVYGSNRGHNSIAMFTVDSATGRLTPAGHQTHEIKTPRNFGIDPTGAYLLVANQDSNSIVVFRIDAKTGGLAPTGPVVEVPKPVCVKFMPRPGA